MRDARSQRLVHDRLSVVITLLVLVVTMIGAVRQAITTNPPWTPAGASPGRIGEALAGELIVRGSVEQIHIINSDPRTEVHIRGPGGFRRTAPTDDRGGLIVRNVPPGEGYTVRIEGAHYGVFPVRVLDPDDDPPLRFYKSQELEPTTGYVETRDGTLLSYRVVLPDPDIFGPPPYDLIVNYSGYTPGLKTNIAYKNKPFKAFSKAGYAVVGVNMRGTGCSGGAFNFMEQLTWLDGYDVVQAFAVQPWVDDIALGSQSWPGLTQLFVASTQPPLLDAIVPGAVVGDFYRDVFYPGGIQNVGFGMAWAAGRDAAAALPSSLAVVNKAAANDPICRANQSLRSQNKSLVAAIKSHPFDSQYWHERSAYTKVNKIAVPTLQIVSWQDPQVGGRPAILFERYAESVPVRLLGTNGFHSYFDGEIWAEIMRFLDVYLRESEPEHVAAYQAEEPVMFLLEKNDAGEARARFSLPSLMAAGDGRRLTLGEELMADDPDSGGGRSTFTYDPSTYAGNALFLPPRRDVVSFTSEPLAETLVMAGSGSVDLWIAVDVRDVDLQVTITEVRPDGQEMYVQSGWLRASHRALDEAASTALRPVQLHTAAAQKDLTPGELTRVRIGLFPFAHAFREGSRIRLIISGPRDAGTSFVWDFETLPGGFNVTIAHSDAYPSSVALPVIEFSEELNLPALLPKCGTLTSQPCRPADWANQ